MASDDRRTPLRAAIARRFRVGNVLVLLSLGVTSTAGCAPSNVRFPLRAPLLVDTDIAPTTVPCRTEDDEVVCTPEPYTSPLAWDAMDKSVFLPLSHTLAVEAHGPATNVNALDEVPDSAWFTNRLGRQRMTHEVLLRGACTDEELLDAEHAAPGSWLIDKGKTDGSTPGFRVVVDGRKYLLKVDKVALSAAASAIGAAIYHAVGFHTSCEQVLYVDPAIFRLKPGLMTMDNSGIARPLDDAALRAALRNATRQGNLVRVQASAWLPGKLLGPFKYEGTRGDDPNDAIDHEHRRELRGGRVLASWLNHFDAREQNSMDSWIASNPDAPASSPGYVRHYYLDLSDVFGAEWEWDGATRRLGKSYLLDWEDMAIDFFTFGLVTRSWDVARRKPGYELFGYFNAENFDPDEWKNEYPNPAFSNATEWDNAWMARILSRFDPEDVRELVALGRFPEERHERYLAEVLEKRLQKILRRYFAVLSPVSDVAVYDGNRVCATDLARRRELEPPGAFHYSARWTHGRRQAAANVRVWHGGRICITLPHVAPPGIADDDPKRYVVLRIDNGQSKRPLLVHFYDLGSQRGYRLVGLERPGD